MNNFIKFSLAALTVCVVSTAGCATPEKFRSEVSAKTDSSSTLNSTMATNKANMAVFLSPDNADAFLLSSVENPDDEVVVNIIEKFNRDFRNGNKFMRTKAYPELKGNLIKRASELRGKEFKFEEIGSLKSDSYDDKTGTYEVAYENFQFHFDSRSNVVIHLVAPSDESFVIKATYAQAEKLANQHGEYRNVQFLITARCKTQSKEKFLSNTIIGSDAAMSIQYTKVEANGGGERKGFNINFGQVKIKKES